jgi:hypothetical protein
VTFHFNGSVNFVTKSRETKGSFATSVCSDVFNRHLCYFDGESINVDEADINTGGMIPAQQRQKEQDTAAVEC